MRVYLDNCCYNRPFDNLSPPMDYTSWRETHMYLDDDIEAVAARAKAAAKEFDAMNGDYTRLQDGVFDDDVAREIDGKISAWKSAIREPVLA